MISGSHYMQSNYLQSISIPKIVKYLYWVIQCAGYRKNSGRGRKSI